MLISVLNFFRAWNSLGFTSQPGEFSVEIQYSTVLGGKIIIMFSVSFVFCRSRNVILHGNFCILTKSEPV
jgi:hypothetical protein